MKPNMVYRYEMETLDGTVLKQFEDDGTENTWKSLDTDKIIRVTFIPAIATLPTHNVFIDHSAGEKFIRRFARGFLKQKIGFNLAEYVNCIVTNRYRFWVFSNGNCLITQKNYEVYI